MRKRDAGVTPYGRLVHDASRGEDVDVGAPATAAYAGEGPYGQPTFKAAWRRGRRTRRAGCQWWSPGGRPRASAYSPRCTNPSLFRDQGKPVDQPRIRRFELVAQTADAIAVKIVGRAYVDYAMVSFGNPWTSSGKSR